MNSREKIKRVKSKIREAAQISPKGRFRVGIHTWEEYEDGPTILSRSEQWSIVKKLEQDGYVKNIELSEDKLWAWMELVPKPKPELKPAAHRRSNLFSQIKTPDEFLQHRELFQKFLGLIGDISDIKPKHIYGREADEQHDDLIQLLIDLKLITCDWDKINSQIHRKIGTRIIEFTFLSDMVLPLYHRVSGRGGFVRKEALELIAKEIGNRMSLSKIVEFFTHRGVPESMFVQGTKWRAVFYALSYFATSKDYKDHVMLLKLIEEVLHPLMFAGDEEKAREARTKYAKWLKYDRIAIDENGKVYLGPSPEEEDAGVDDWVDSNGKTVEPSAYLILLPNKLAELTVLWTQVLILAAAYQNQSGANRKELERLYLEVIKQVEAIIESGKIGGLNKKYERPFSSLATAAMEAHAKKKSIDDMLTGFMTEINALQPDAGEMQKQVEKHAELTAKVMLTARLILSDGKEVSFEHVAYDQAVFLLKLIFGKIFKILDAVASGPINIADEELNAKYILLFDALQKLFERPDLQEIKKQLPDDLPEHLFENWGDMDVWWEYGNPRLMQFYGEVEKLWVLSGQRSFPVINELGLLFDSVEGKVGEHNKVKSSRWNQMLKNIDVAKERGEFSFGDQPPKQRSNKDRPGEFAITIRDREIRVNDFILSRPYGAGKNMAFFEYIISKPGEEIARAEMPEHVQKDLGNRSFSKVFNAIGFKGEILKAFVPKRGKSSLLFRKSVPAQTLEGEGIKLQLLLQELGLAHTKNSPK